MNSYRFKDLYVGMQESFTTSITQEKMDMFCQITGDVSPIHMQDAAARLRGHTGRVVYGMLGASFFSTLAGVYLPGQHCLLHSVQAKFVKPVYIGNSLRVTGEIVQLNETFKTIEIKAYITGQAGEKLLRGNIMAGLQE